MWVARNEDGSLWIFIDKPIKHKNIQFGDSWQWKVSTSMFSFPKSMLINSSLFPELKYEDGPKEITLNLKEAVDM